jgi:hypothetical protein
LEQPYPGTGQKFPSEKIATPTKRDNLWRRAIELKPKEIGLDWVNF